MKKYNLSEIMKNAWNLVKAENITMSAALKKAWASAKNAIVLPELVGSPKQVAWAEDIRRDRADGLKLALSGRRDYAKTYAPIGFSLSGESYREFLFRDMSDAHFEETLKHGLDLLRNALTTQTSAKVWIAHR